jgi:N-acetylmuramoyl-L-alanine amidase
VRRDCATTYDAALAPAPRLSLESEAARQPNGGVGMRADSGRLGSRRRWAVAVALVTLIVCAAAASAAWASGTQASPGASAAPAAGAASPAASSLADPAPSIAWSLTPLAVVYGDPVTAQGTVTPAVAGDVLTVAINGVALPGLTATTDASGAFSLTFVPTGGGAVTVARADGTTSTPQDLLVTPKVMWRAGATMPWDHTRLTFTIAPTTYDGLVTVTVYHHSKKVAVVKGYAANGKLTLAAPTFGIGAFPLHVLAAAAGDLGAAPQQTATLHAGFKRIAVGSKGPYVRVLLSRLAALRFRVPGMSSTLSVQAGDSIVAFQKAYGLSRTYVFAAADWRKLDTARIIKAVHKSPATHIEIDKTRQILMVVKGGVPYGIIAVSTGRTGNTPVGRFHILRKAPSTSTWLGTATLWRTMDFHGNFAMHGYPEVPPYPASHGCVREPMWVADWTYRQSWVGETVYIHY